MKPQRPLFPDQEYFSIGEASRIVQVPDYTLRYWESRLRALRPARRDTGHRRYTKRDLEMIVRIRDLIRGRHMTLAGARREILRGSRGSGREAPGAEAPAAGPAEKILRDLRSEIEDILSELK